MAVLAAGSSRRFGAQDKLAQPFRGKRLGEHATSSMPIERAAPGCACVITSEFGHPCEAAWEEAGFGIGVNLEAKEGMGTSLAHAAVLCAKADCDTLLVALADMPFVPRSHFEALIAACDSASDCICSSDGSTRMPPAIFGADHLPRLWCSSGDEGARRWLSDARVVTAPSEWLIDIDTPEALARFS